jgi:hypothetical protein
MNRSIDPLNFHFNSITLFFGLRHIQPTRMATTTAVAMTVTVCNTSSFWSAIDITHINRLAGINDADTSIQVNSATISYSADSEAKVEVGKKSKVKYSVLTAVQSATRDQPNVNSDNDVNVNVHGLDILSRLGQPNGAPSD